MGLLRRLSVGRQGCLCLMPQIHKWYTSGGSREVHADKWQSSFKTNTNAILPAHPVSYHFSLCQFSESFLRKNQLEKLIWTWFVHKGATYFLKSLQPHLKHWHWILCHKLKCSKFETPSHQRQHDVIHYPLVNVSSEAICQVHCTSRLNCSKSSQCFTLEKPLYPVFRL